VRALLDAGERLREAQAEALGGGDPDEVQRAADAERAAVRELAAVARRSLGVSDAVADRVASTLRAAALDEDGRELLARGRLTRELEPGGFELVTGVAPGSGLLQGRKAPAAAKRKPAAKAKPKPKRPDPRIKRARTALEKARERERRALDAAREARARAERADAAVARATAEREAAERALDALGV
jgi:hypothetical protein